MKTESENYIVENGTRLEIERRRRIRKRGETPS
jgi:hypothetical protein